MLSSKCNCIAETGNPRAMLVKKGSPVYMGKKLTNTDCTSTGGVYTLTTMPVVVFVVAITFPVCFAMKSHFLYPS